MHIAYFLSVIVLTCLTAGRIQAGEPDALEILQHLASETKRTIPPGTYRLPEGGVVLRDLHDVEIDGTGVRLIATDLAAPALKLTGCRNIKLKGLTIDFDPLPFTQGTITAIDAKAMTVDFEIHGGYPELPVANKLRHIHLFDKEGNLWKREAPDYYAKKVERLDGRKCRAYFSKDTSGFGRFEVGDKVALNIRRKSAISIGDGSGGVALEDVTIQSAPGIAILVRYAEDGGSYKRVRVMPGPTPDGATEPRLLSSSADALNIAYTRKGPVVEDCEFSRMGDDSINLHGVVFPVLKWLDGSTFLTMRPHRGEDFDKVLRKGDEIRFLQGGDFRVLQTAKIEKVEKTTEDSKRWEEAFHRYWPSFPPSDDFGFFRVKLDQEIKDVPEGAYSEIPASAAEDFVIRDSYFHDHRARGLRLMSRNGIVEGNRFERIKGVAISVGPQFPYWAEAGWCEKISISKNRITDVAEGTEVSQRDSYTLGAISISCRMGEDTQDDNYYQGNRDISITDNVISGCSVDGINVSAARDVVIRGNTIERVNLRSCPDAGSKHGLKGGQPISIIQAQAAVENNTIK